jgi:beta-N-acetylhexosaminidase
LRRRSRTRPSPWSRTPPTTCPSRRKRIKRIRLYGISGGADFTRADPLAYLDTVKEELEAAGFEVHVFKTADQREAAGRPA